MFALIMRDMIIHDLYVLYVYVYILILKIAHKVKITLVLYST